MKRCGVFGEKVGLAFQIKDDLLDLGDGTRIGKPTGVDIKEKKLTLPLIHTLNTYDSANRTRLLKLIRKAPYDPEAVNAVMSEVLEGLGMDYARGKMNDLRDEAVALLDRFENTEAKKSLIALLDFTIERNK